MYKDGPPWYGTHPDGTTHYSGVPDRLLHHPDLLQRGIVLNDTLNPGFVFWNYTKDGPQYAVKVLRTETEELAIYERLLKEVDCPQNHILPSEIVTSDHPLLIMPRLGSIINAISIGPPPLRRVLDIFYDLIEGLEYIHDRCIAHLDLCTGNVLVAHPNDTVFHKEIIPWRAYIIDFDTSQQLKFGPGVQPVIPLPEMQVSPPNGLLEFDPYAWDVYCLGLLLMRALDNQLGQRQRYYWTARWFARWLIGNERGCDGRCRCRPTVRVARRVLQLIRPLAPLLDICERAYEHVRPPKRK
ncbi:kinase-like domain-containing protein [Trametes maxima]|nr:kinase-like domain-containing protein [Trametes maxima]